MAEQQLAELRTQLQELMVVVNRQEQTIQNQQLLFQQQQQQANGAQAGQPAAGPPGAQGM